MTYSTILLEHEGPVDWVTLNRPASLNAISHAMIEELYAYFDALTRNYATRIVVLRGAGRGFCSGLDLREGLPPPVAQNDAKEPSASLPQVVRLMRACPQPIISLIHGPACGGGFMLALASDIRIAGDTGRMNDAFIKLGLSGCELGMSYFLPRTVGLSVASELMLTGNFIDAPRALSTGLVSRVVPDHALAQAARELIAPMLQTTPHGLRSTKQTLNQALALNDLGTVIDLEERAQILCMLSPDARRQITQSPAQQDG
ncbi:MAG TPA: enoyl-CoA hydratase/isomerase family protein [Steroidobacteraceae bacterium]|nr:enoyl-CoA hydratase/isomerase family protein [Steroidobacteraceae bacterium]